MRRWKNHGLRNETSKTQESDKEGHTEKEKVACHAFLLIIYFFLDKTGDFWYRFSLYSKFLPQLPEGICIRIH